MTSINCLNPKAEVAKAQAALSVNISAAKGLEDVLRSNLGPKGTLKMLVSGALDIKMTKDGHTLLREMQIKNPTASFIAGLAATMDQHCGDGSSSAVVLIAELLHQSEKLVLDEGVHPRLVTKGFRLAQAVALNVLQDMRVLRTDRETLLLVAQTALSTKLARKLGNHMAEAVTDAVFGCAKQKRSQVY